MMKKIKIFIVLLVLFLSVSAVSAEGNFTALQSEINSATGSLNLTQNYVYNHESDGNLSGGIVINTSNIVINGNGFTIDGANQARIFLNVANNITINNLTLINGRAFDGSAIRVEKDSSIITNNVIFENNTAIRAPNILTLGDYTSINDKFIANCVEQGSAIYSTEGSVSLINGTFISDDTLKWSMLYLTKSMIYIENTTFANLNSNYSTAMYIEDCKGKIKNCNFVNLTAAMTAGAIGIKSIPEEIIIEDCNFFQVASEKNGGAVFVDAAGMNGLNNGNVTILNSQFIDCYSEFGGAYLQLSGNLTIDNTNFTSNVAAFAGGAIYTSWVTVNITNSTISSNIAFMGNYSMGGAAYIDAGIITLDSCVIEDNAAHEGSSIFAYDTELILSDNYFNNPATDDASIYAVFIKGYLESGNNFTDDVLSLDNLEYNVNVDGVQAEYSVINNTINVVTLPKRFDLRDWGWVSSVKNQGSMGACWSFGMTGALESVLIRFGNITYDFSENSLQNAMLKYSKYGDLNMNEGGNMYDGLAYFASWLGATPAEHDTYDELGKISQLTSSTKDVQIKDIVLITPRANSTDNTKLKEAILKYGSLAVGYNHLRGPQYFNETAYAYYSNETLAMNHIVGLVGWDDNYPKENFIMTPPGDGAFILKNSWGTEWGEEGFFYISYYDTSFSMLLPALTFIIENNIEYNTLYQHEICLSEMINHTYSMNKYVAEGNQFIGAVGFVADDGNAYNISVLVNGKNVYNQSGTTTHSGYSTIKLNEYVPVKMGDEFAIVVNTKITYLSSVRGHAKPNSSFISYDGVNWENLGHKHAAVIKAYALDMTIFTEDLVKIYKNDSQFEANVGAANETVIFEINGMNYTRTTNENGTAKMNINLGPGNYTITTYYNGESVKNSIEVLPTLIGDNLVKYYRNESQFYVTLIDGEGNPVSDAMISMNINGVFYDRKTNENGTAKLNINLGAGEYILTAMDPITGLQMSYNITVLSRLNATNLTMKYLDNSTFNVTVVDGQGNPLKDVGVTFNINGVFYTRYTDSNGTARLNIRLMPGEYIITSEYDNCRIANTITIKD